MNGSPSPETDAVVATNGSKDEHEDRSAMLHVAPPESSDDEEVKEEERESFLEKAEHTVMHLLHLDKAERPKEEAMWFVDNSVLRADTDGLAYRRSKSIDDKVYTLDESSDIVSWGKLVPGVDEGDGWLRVRDYFLPFVVGGVAVLIPEAEAKAPKVGTLETVVERQESPAAQSETAKFEPLLEELPSPARASREAAQQSILSTEGAGSNTAVEPGHKALMQLCKDQAERITELESELQSSEPQRPQSLARDLTELKARHEAKMEDMCKAQAQIQAENRDLWVEVKCLVNSVQVLGARCAQLELCLHEDAAVQSARSRSPPAVAVLQGVGPSRSSRGIVSSTAVASNKMMARGELSSYSSMNTIVPAGMLAGSQPGTPGFATPGAFTPRAGGSSDDLAVSNRSLPGRMEAVNLEGRPTVVQTPILPAPGGDATLGPLLKTAANVFSFPSDTIAGQIPSTSGGGSLVVAAGGASAGSSMDLVVAPGTALVMSGESFEVAPGAQLLAKKGSATSPTRSQRSPRGNSPPVRQSGPARNTGRKMSGLQQGVAAVPSGVKPAPQVKRPPMKV